MTYIAYVKTRNGQRKHSAWNNQSDCLKQVQTIKGHGYCALWDSIPPRLMFQMDIIFKPSIARWQYSYVGMLLLCFVFK